DPRAGGSITENVFEGGRVRIADENLVTDPAKECFIAELAWRQVGREYQHHIKRHDRRLARLEREVIDRAVHRDHPPVKELIGPHALAAEVIDDEHAIVRFELGWRDVELANRRITELQV